MPAHLRPVADPMQPCTRCNQVHDRCSGHRRDGKPCTKYPNRGTTVCRMHGAGAPQVKASARQRLLEAADPAAAELTRLLGDTDPAIRLRAATALLDRAGHGPSSTQTNLNVDAGQVHYQIEGVDLEAL